MRRRRSAGVDASARPRNHHTDAERGGYHCRDQVGDDWTDLPLRRERIVPRFRGDRRFVRRRDSVPVFYWSGPNPAADWVTFTATQNGVTATGTVATSYNLFSIAPGSKD